MTLQLVLELKATTSAAIELDTGVSCDSQSLAVGRERVVGDWVVEKLVNLWGRHVDDRRSSLLSLRL